MKQTFILVIVFASLALCRQALAQSVQPGIINATGGAGNISGNFFDYSIGEMTMVSTFSGAGAIVTQGLLQTELFPSLGVPKTSIANRILVFPNPASTFVNLCYTSSVQGRLSYRLMDMAGRVLLNHNTVVSQGVTQEQLNISEFSVASYLLEVSFITDNGAREMASYKIDKLK